LTRLRRQVSIARPTIKASMEKPPVFPAPKTNAMVERSIELVVAQLAAARGIAIKLSHGHEPDPALVAGLVQAMATNYLAEMSRKGEPLKAEPKIDPMATGKFAADMLKVDTWPKLGDSKRVG
jgi:hypothetical protein